MLQSTIKNPGPEKLAVGPATTQDSVLTKPTIVLLAVGCLDRTVGRVDQWQGRLAGLEDRLAAWAYSWIEAHPVIADHLERLLHAFGFHGPSARHLLRTRVVPIAGFVAILLLVFVVFRLCRWALRNTRGRRETHRVSPVSVERG